MTTTAMQVPTVLNLRVRNYNIEGPTKAQARKMAAERMRLLASAEKALAAGNDDLAFENDCRAMDIEADLVRFGFAKLI